MELELNETFSVRPEILYSEKGTKIFTGADSWSFTSYYLETPLFLNIFHSGDRLSEYFSIGPYYGYWFAGKHVNVTEGKETIKNHEFDDDLNDNGIANNHNEFGFIGGGGVKIKYNTHQFNIMAFYQNGVTDLRLFKQKQSDYKKFTNSVIKFSVSYLFNL